MKTSRFLNNHIGKNIVFWPIEDEHKEAKRKMIGLIIGIDENGVAKVLRDQLTIDVKTDQTFSII